MKNKDKGMNGKGGISHTMGLHTASRKFVSRNITGQEKMGGCDEERK
jgi:hypothetical protein